MAPPADKKLGPIGTGVEGSTLQELRTQVNNLTESVRLLTAKLDLDAGVTDTNYKALITESGVATAPVKLVP